jgi:hypothetical protein
MLSEWVAGSALSYDVCVEQLLPLLLEAGILLHPSPGSTSPAIGSIVGNNSSADEPSLRLAFLEQIPLLAKYFMQQQPQLQPHPQTAKDINSLVPLANSPEVPVLAPVPMPGPYSSILDTFIPIVAQLTTDRNQQVT